MILSYRDSAPQVPISSSCIIKTKGRISDGDVVSVTSPLFQSVNFSVGGLNSSNTFEVTFVSTNKEGFIDNTNGDMIGILTCTDNDLFNLTVSEKI